MANTFRPKLKMLGILMAACCSPVFCTAQFFDDFSDRNLTTEPEWLGNTQNFEINNDLQLQLNDDEAGVSYLSTVYQLMPVCEWNFWVNLKFSPSSNNYCRIYLASDKQDLTDESLNGYFLQLGESGSNDAIELFRQEGLNIYSVCRGTEGLISSSFEIRIKIIRSENGNWEIYVDQNGGNLFTLEANGTDNEITNSGYFGFYCKYTSSYSTKFYFDEVYVGEPIIDETLPELLSIETIQANQLQLKFSEALHPESVVPENFSINQGVGNPVLVQADEAFQMLDLFFENSFQENTENTLELQNITDFSGNEMEQNSFSFFYYILKNADLTINEILFDPLEGSEEFVEIYNKSDKTLNLKKLCFGKIKYDFPNPPDTTLVSLTSTSVYIQPGEYWVITPDPEKVKSSYNCNYPNRFVETKNMPDLINSEGHLFLVSDSGILIDEAKYQEDWHHPSLNFTDGVSLEKIHFNANGLSQSSWQSASINAGFATPTDQNSQFTETSTANENIILSHEIFSPDQDGVDDVLAISMSFNKAGNSVNIYIFNSEGQQIRHLVKNELAAVSNTYFWDGLNEDNQTLNPGIYLLYFEVSNLEGGFEKAKKTVVLARKFN